MHFGSDNWAGAHPAISRALEQASTGFSPAYGASETDSRALEAFERVFGRKVSVFFVGTGTAANALAMCSVNRPGGVVFAQAEAHMIADECGAVEYLTNGARLCPVEGEAGKIDPERLGQAIARYPAAFVHSGQPMAVSITQASEVGTVYSVAEIRAIADVAHRHGLPLHMDGARFANALVHLGVTAAEMTHEAGVDMISFGGTKNGCWMAEALVILDPEKASAVPFLRKRAAQLFSKSRFIAAQFEAYFEGGLWLDMARHANAMAARLADHISASPRLRLAWRPQANEVFAVMEEATMAELNGKGARFYPWPRPHFLREDLRAGETLTRFVTSFATSPAEVDAFGELVR